MSLKSTEYYGKGINQNNCFPRALSPDYVKLDDRKIENLLTYMAEYSHLIKYYDHNFEADGNWSDFLYNDVSFVLAGMLTVDLKAIEEDQSTYLQDYFNCRQNKLKLIHITNHYERLFGIAISFDRWLKQLSGLARLGSSFEVNIESEYLNIMEEKVRPLVRLLHRYAMGSTMSELSRPKAFLNDFSQLDQWWGIDSNQEPENAFVGDSLEEKLHSAFLKLRVLNKQLLSALKYLTIHMRPFLDKSINNKNDHKAHIGILICFCKLFQHVQGDFNMLSSRYLKYYYEQVLNESPRASSPDQVHVCFQISKGLKNYLLPQSTVLEAGTDENGQEIHFETAHDVTLNHIEIDSILSLYLSKRDQVDSSQYELISDIYASIISDKKRTPNDSLDSISSFPLFGEEQEYKPSDLQNMTQADIGWAISSASMFLSEGNRELRFKLTFSAASTQMYKQILLDIQSRINIYRRQNEESTISMEETFYERIFNETGTGRSFRVFLTASDGWYEIEEEYISVKACGEGTWQASDDVELLSDSMSILNALEITVRIPETAGAITGFHQSNHGDGPFEPDIPCAKILINNNKQPYCYSFLKDLELESFRVDCNVKNYKTLHFFDENGANLPRQGFTAFGTEPFIDNALLIDAPEVFQKHIDHLTIKMDWKGIPATVEEFRSYYSAYPEEYHPSEYKVHISALSEGVFSPSSENTDLMFSLFGDNIEELGDSELLPPYFPIDKSTFVLDQNKTSLLNISPDEFHKSLDSYLPDTRNGLIKISLAEPSYCFGHSRYNTSYTDAVANNSNPNREEEKPIPNSPYTPEIQRLTLNYTAHDEWHISKSSSFSSLRAYQISPFGAQATVRRGRALVTKLLPEFTSDGYLFLGLKNVNAPESVAIHFELSNKHTKSFIEYNSPKVKWTYLRRNTWIDFRGFEILRDTTEGFTTSGIIEIQLPADISNRSTVMPSELFWIRAEVVGDTELLSQCLSLQTNAVIAKRRSNNQKNEVLPPYSINDTAANLAEIKEVHQPYESFGGRRKESESDFFRRVSERLHHKNRAITQWDYERLVLNQFKEIFQIKCISKGVRNIRTSNKQAPQIDPTTNGHKSFKNGVTLVLVPFRTKHLNEITPRFNFHFLEKVKKYLLSKTSPFVQLNVINPVYEYIRILAKVKFIDGQNNGSSLIQLKKDIQHFISPWIKDESKNIDIGGELNENILQDFIKGLDYVQFLTAFSILHIVEEEGVFKIQDTAEEKSSVVINAAMNGIFVPDEDHDIEIIDHENEITPRIRINTEEVIRFQNRVNILGSKKYIKITPANIDSDFSAAAEQSPDDPEELTVVKILK